MNENQEGENLEESQEPTFGFPFGIPFVGDNSITGICREYPRFYCDF